VCSLCGVHKTKVRGFKNTFFNPYQPHWQVRTWELKLSKFKVPVTWIPARIPHIDNFDSEQQLLQGLV
jgi:hypothetical protein